MNVYLKLLLNQLIKIKLLLYFIKIEMELIMEYLYYFHYKILILELNFGENFQNLYDLIYI